ncbi:MAG: hypothetical protein NG740_01295 [Omnitrophica bacterium]|nr:hypothetical protein [Candidatus Omnitrophota bacterium]
MTVLFALAADIRDIKPPVYFKGSYFFLILLATAGALALIAFLANFLYKKYKKNKTIPLAPPKTPYEIACEALSRLKSQDLPSHGKMKEYYSGLSGIVRVYTEGRFAIRAPEMTTEEFLHFLRNSDALSGPHKNLLKEFLVLCDAVKFAKYGPSRKESGESMISAKKIIDETKPVPKEPEEVAVV